MKERMVCMTEIVHAPTTFFQPPSFRVHPFLFGGHLQTLATVAPGRANGLSPTQIRVPVSDGDSIMLHRDRPTDRPRGDAVLLVHGLTGCHAAPYMIRLATRLTQAGVTVYRMDMRGFGAATALTKNLSHAGRSDDCLAALAVMADEVPGKLFGVGVSLGGNQLLRGLGRIGRGVDAAPGWIDRLGGIIAVSPPIDLLRCSDRMQRRRMRPYNRYFIRSLLRRIPPGVAARADFGDCIGGPRPRTLRELDERFTAPLSGFENAAEYYAWSSANRVTASIRVPALVVTSADDPIVPVGCFTDDRNIWSPSTQLIVTPRGGHVGFVDWRRKCWMDDVVAQWIEYQSPESESE